MVPIIAPHKNIDPIGDAIVEGLLVLGAHGAMQQARDVIANNLHRLVRDYDSGKFRLHPAARFGYFAENGFARPRRRAGPASLPAPSLSLV